MPQKLLTTGAFARLCKTTKETLFHYDRENVLRPRYTASNGYRYYALDQLWDFEIIATLKDIGSSLQEIRYYLQDTEPARLLPFLKEKDRALDEEIARLRLRKLFLGDILKSLSELSSSRLDTVSLVRQKEALLEVWPIAPDDARNACAVWETFFEYLEYYRERNRVVRWPFGMLMNRIDEDSETDEPGETGTTGQPGATSSTVHKAAQRPGRYVWRCFFGLAPAQTGDAVQAPDQMTDRMADRTAEQAAVLPGPPGPLGLAVRREGLYAVCLHEGNYLEQEEALTAFLDVLHRRGLRHDGQIYCSDMLVYSRHQDKTSYVNRYSVRLEEDESAARRAGASFPLGG